MDRATVVTTVFNGASFVGRYCENVAVAAHLDLDWILVDDGSDDNTAEAVTSKLRETGLESRVRVLQPGRLGRPKALNFAVDQVTTAMHFQLDFDDESWAVRYPLQLELLAAHPNLACVGAGYEHVWADHGRAEIRCLDFDPVRYARYFPLYVPFPHTFMAFRTAAVRAVGGYPEWDDYEEMGLIGRLLARGYQIDSVDQVVGRHFIYAASYFERQHSFARRRFRALRRQLSMRRQFPFIRPSPLTMIARFAYSFLPDSIRRAVRRAVGHAH